MNANCWKVTKRNCSRLQQRKKNARADHVQSGCMITTCVKTMNAEKLLLWADNERKLYRLALRPSILQQWPHETMDGWPNGCWKISGALQSNVTLTLTLIWPWPALIMPVFASLTFYLLQLGPHRLLAYSYKAKAFFTTGLQSLKNALHQSPSLTDWKWWVKTK